MCVGGGGGHMTAKKAKSVYYTHHRPSEAIRGSLRIQVDQGLDGVLPTPPAAAGGGGGGGRFGVKGGGSRAGHFYDGALAAAALESCHLPASSP